VGSPTPTPATPVTIPSDGADGPRSLGEAASPGPTRHVLGWFHLAMRVQHVAQAATCGRDATEGDPYNIQRHPLVVLDRHIAPILSSQLPRTITGIVNLTRGRRCCSNSGPLSSANRAQKNRQHTWRRTEIAQNCSGTGWVGNAPPDRTGLGVIPPISGRSRERRPKGFIRRSYAYSTWSRASLFLRLWAT
jgi:hypothetical protein